MPSSWVYVTGDSYPFRALEPADVLVARIDEAEDHGDRWVAVFAESPIDENDEDAGTYKRTVMIRASQVTAVGPANEAE